MTAIALMYVLGLGLSTEGFTLDFDKEIERHEKVIRVTWIDAKRHKKMRFVGHYKICSKYKGTKKYARCNKYIAMRRYQAYKRWLADQRLKKGDVNNKPWQVVLLPKGR